MVTNKLFYSALIGAALLFAPVKATTYYVSSSGGDSNDGRSPDRPWKTMAKVNSMTFASDDTVRFNGTFTDATMGDPGSGTQSAPIVFIGEGSLNGRARLSAINLSNTKYAVFKNFDASSSGNYATPVQLGGTVSFVRFENLYLHTAYEGVTVSAATVTDVTFINTLIDSMRADGILLNDNAGDRFSFIGGSIRNTGLNPPSWNTHGCYASGGHGHIFDGVTFANNASGWSVSIRRGNMTVRNCRFSDVKPAAGTARGGSGFINNNNEDEGTVNPNTGTPSRDLTYYIYRNVFVGPGTAIYQSTNNDVGIDDPGNHWVVFNNTFINTTVNFGGGTSQYYDFYLRNNAFVNSSLSLKTGVSGKVREVSNNGWWNSGSAQGTSNVTTDPQLDAQKGVTAVGYRDKGIVNPAPGVTMVPDNSNPLGFAGAAPDIGASEYVSTTQAVLTKANALQRGVSGTFSVIAGMSAGGRFTGFDVKGRDVAGSDFPGLLIVKKTLR